MVLALTMTNSWFTFFRGYFEAFNGPSWTLTFMYCVFRTRKNICWRYNDSISNSVFFLSFSFCSSGLKNSVIFTVLSVLPVSFLCQVFFLSNSCMFYFPINVLFSVLLCMLFSPTHVWFLNCSGVFFCPTHVLPILFFRFVYICLYFCFSSSCPSHVRFSIASKYVFCTVYLFFLSPAHVC